MVEGLFLARMQKHTSTPRGDQKINKSICWKANFFEKKVIFLVFQKNIQILEREKKKEDSDTL